MIGQLTDPATWVLFIGILIFLMIFVLPGFTLVRDDQVGILTRVWWGRKMRPGQIIATNGEIGVQATTLMPGLYWYFPVFWRTLKDRVIRIQPGEIGLVTSIDGKPLEPGRVLGDEVECNLFQDAKAFLEGQGRKAVQIGYLKPGTYRINTKVFQVSVVPAVNIPEGKIGVVTAEDGIPLESDYIVSPAPEGDHQHFQDGQAFINARGHRGVQLETLQPGQYYINTNLFKVEIVDVVTVPPGYVAVIISSAGKALERDTSREARAPPAPVSLKPDLNQPVHDWAEAILITRKDTRGIWKDPVAPGTYNLNPVAYRAELVPTSAVTIDWASHDPTRETSVRGVSRPAPDSEEVAAFFRFSQLKVTSKDGFLLEVDVRLIIRIMAENAPFVIARFGTVNNLIEQVAHPLIDSSFRNQAGQQQALEFVHSRTDIQMKALERAREEFKRYHVEVQSLMIAYIAVDPALLQTQTAKEIAVQQQKQFDEQAAAQEKRIAVQEKTARADMQPRVITAVLGVDIAKNEAQANINLAEGQKQSTILKADGDQYAAQAVGEGQAAAYEAQQKALGRDAIALLQIIQRIADGKIVVTPNILVEGGEGGSSGLMIQALLAKFLAGESIPVELSPKPGETPK